MRACLLPEVAYPFLANVFESVLPNPAARLAFRVRDAFVVKYSATGGQTLLKPHRDGAAFSFNVALNKLSDYEGGGTWFQMLDSGEFQGAALRSPQGHILAHSSALLHGGKTLASGVRYILAVFVTFEDAYSGWERNYFEDVQSFDESSDIQSTFD